MSTAIDRRGPRRQPRGCAANRRRESRAGDRGPPKLASRSSKRALRRRSRTTWRRPASISARRVVFSRRATALASAARGSGISTVVFIWPTVWVSGRTLQESLFELLAPRREACAADPTAAAGRTHASIREYRWIRAFRRVFRATTVAICNDANGTRPFRSDGGRATSDRHRAHHTFCAQDEWRGARGWAGVGPNRSKSKRAKEKYP